MKRAFFTMMALLCLAGFAFAATPNPVPYQLGGGGSWVGTINQVTTTSSGTASRFVSIKLFVAAQTGPTFSGTLTIDGVAFTGSGDLDGAYLSFSGSATSGSVNLYGNVMFVPGPRIILGNVYRYGASGTSYRFGDALLTPVSTP